MGPGEVDHRPVIGHLHHGIRDGLGVERAGGRRQRGLPRRRILGVDEGVAYAELDQVVREEPVGTPVDSLLHQQVIARAEHGEQRRGDGGHARGEHRGRRAALQGGELGGQRAMVRQVGQPGVDDIRNLRFPRQLEHSVLEDGHVRRATDARARLARVHQERRQAVAGAAGGRARHPTVSQLSEKWMPMDSSSSSTGS